MELKEAEKIIKNSFLFKDANEHIQLKEAISTVLQANELARKSLIENSNIADERNDLLVEVQRLKDKPYEFGLVVGTKRERDYWKNKIKEKIGKIEADNEQDTESVKRYEEMRRNTQDSFYRNNYQKSIFELNTKRSMRKMFISILEELLKGE